MRYLGKCLGLFIAGVAVLMAYEVPDEPPERLTAVAPRYPYEMVKAKLRGSVVLEFYIDENGVVSDLQVIRSTNATFNAPALEALSQWRFKPARKNGRPIGLVARQQLEFDPDDGTPPTFEAPPAAEIAKLPPEYRYNSAPLIKAMSTPVYPFESARDGRDGTATVRFLIEESGNVSHCEVLKATRPEFGLAVQAMLEAAQFTPALQGTKPVPAMFTLSRSFRHKDAKGDVPLSSSARWILAELRKENPAIVPLGELDSQPKPTTVVTAVFPKDLVGKVDKGQALIEFYLDFNGMVQLPHVVSATHPAFGFAAVQAVSLWSFEPALQGGKPVVAWVRVPLEFRVGPAAGQR